MFAPPAHVSSRHCVEEEKGQNPADTPRTFDKPCIPYLPSFCKPLTAHSSLLAPRSSSS